MKSSGNRSRLRRTCSFEPRGSDAVDRRQVAIEDDAAAAQDEDGAGDIVNRHEGRSLRLSHAQLLCRLCSARTVSSICFGSASGIQVMVVDGPKRVETQ